MFGGSSTTATASGGFGSFFSSVATKIKTVASDIKSLISEQRKEEKEDTPKASPPWEDIQTNDEKIKEEVRTQILELTSNKRNFLNAPPEDDVFEFNFDDYVDIAQVSLQSDINLSDARFYLVPKYIKEPRFWRNYFYRVYVIKSSYGVWKPPTKKDISLPSNESSSSVELSEVTPPDLSEESFVSISSPLVKESKKEERLNTGEDVGDFVSDLGFNKKSTGESNEADKDEDDWEKELKAELGSLDVDDDKVEIDETWEEQMKRELEGDVQ